MIGNLKALMVYKTDNVELVIEELKQHEAENVLKWVFQIDNSMVTLNQTQFLELLKIR